MAEPTTLGQEPLTYLGSVPQRLTTHTKNALGNRRQNELQSLLILKERVTPILLNMRIWSMHLKRACTDAVYTYRSKLRDDPSHHRTLQT